MKLTMEDAKIVAKALELLEQPGAHVQHTEGSTGRTGRYYDLQACKPTDPEARSWCAIGALKKVGASSELRMAVGAFIRTGVLISMPSFVFGSERDIIELNDSRGGRKKIRAKLSEFIHAIVKMETEKVKNENQR